MATVFTTGPDMDIDAVLQYLAIARQHYTQQQIADHLGLKDAKTIRRWETGESKPKPYAAQALRQLILPFGTPSTDDAAFRFIDLFAGIGGIRAAFEGIGGRCVFTSEWDSYAQKTYAENFHDGHLIAGDITQIEAKDVPDHEVLLAGFPCQPFSIAGVSKKNALGRAHGFHDETQGTLFFDVCRIIEAKQPRAFLLENVKNLMSHDKGRTFDVIRRALLDLGYHIHYRFIDGAHFTPQHRERILIVGFREDVPFDFDALPLPEKGSKRMRDILHRTDGSEPRLDWDGDKYFDHAGQAVLAKYTLTDKLWAYLQNYAQKHKAAGNGFGFGLVYPDSVSRTLSARYYKDGSEILVWQGEGKNPRRLTPRECARLMGFPDSYRIPVSDTKGYEQFSQAAVVPMLEVVARLMAPHLIKRESAPAHTADAPKIMTTSNLWTREQLKLAFHLYCQLPFGKLHKSNPEIVRLAGLIGRTPSAVAMKLVNFASLDPAITSTGRKGLDGASKLDREIWADFHADWEGLAVQCELLRRELDPEPAQDEADEQLLPEDFTGETRRVVTEQRIKQSFFRRAVLSSYGGRCCMSGVSEPRLLIASHIVPWSKDKQNRLNPSNGLCLSAIHDRAFDTGLITLSDDFRVIVSDELKRRDEAFVQAVFLPLEGCAIALPERFVPDSAFIARHRAEEFIDNRKAA
ncbi:DNA (cytosine-5-)-methyltransferase [Niveibacterium sp. 24ML]|uniref:DNA (cytosine-5-)-methyltransferase n=1 Tax=Niveibacterium sp. 24ML TaxID=2985512 RepID=UPI002B4BACC1|nr:DNA (cytosine-5-)-methyltransferase [Niveibacterium sp. 24ML]